MKKQVFKLLEAYINYKLDRFLRKQWRANCVINNIDPDLEVEGENEYKSLWQQLDKRVEPFSYRLFSHYMGNTPHIIPESVGISMIERYLNPRRYRDFYYDKNLFGQIYGIENVAETIIARINKSRLLNALLEPIHNLNKAIKDISVQELSSYLVEQGCEKIVLKPSVDSSSGNGVMLFVKDKNVFISSDGKHQLGGYF